MLTQASHLQDNTLQRSQTNLFIFEKNSITYRPYKKWLLNIQKVLMHLSFTQTDKPHYFPELKISFFETFQRA